MSRDTNAYAWREADKTFRLSRLPKAKRDPDGHPVVQAANKYATQQELLKDTAQRGITVVWEDGGVYPD